MAMNTRTSECPDLQDLAAWVDGNVDDATRARLVEHVATCSDCFEIVTSALEWKESEATPSPTERDGAPRESGVIPFSPRRRFSGTAALPLAATLAVALIGWRVYATQMKAAQNAATVAVSAAAQAGDAATLQAYAPPGIEASSLVESLENSATRGDGEGGDGVTGGEGVSCGADCEKNATLALAHYRRWSRFSREAQMGFLSTLALVPTEIVGNGESANVRETQRLTRSSDLAVRVSAYYVLDVAHLSKTAEIKRLVNEVDPASLNVESAAYFLARLAERVGNTSAAHRAYQRFLEISPKAQSAWRTEAERILNEGEASNPPTE